MSWYNSLHDLGGDLKHAGKVVGKTLDNKWVQGGLGAALAASGVGIPAAALLVGGAGAAGKAAQGGKIGNILREGASGTAHGGLGAAAGGGLRSLLSSPAAPGAIESGAASGIADEGAGAGAGVVGAGTGVPVASPASSVAPGGFRGALHWAGQHPEAVGQGLSALGSIPSEGAKTRMLNNEADLSAFELARKKRIAQQQQSFAGSNFAPPILSPMSSAIAPNPYTTQGA